MEEYLIRGPAWSWASPPTEHVALLVKLTTSLAGRRKLKGQTVLMLKREEVNPQKGIKCGSYVKDRYHKRILRIIPCTIFKNLTSAVLTIKYSYHLDKTSAYAFSTPLIYFTTNFILKLAQINHTVLTHVKKKGSLKLYYMQKR